MTVPLRAALYLRDAQKRPQAARASLRHWWPPVW
jgi:hypothetical protein